MLEQQWGAGLRGGCGLQQHSDRPTGKGPPHRHNLYRLGGNTSTTVCCMHVEYGVTGVCRRFLMLAASHSYLAQHLARMPYDIGYGCAWQWGQCIGPVASGC